MELDLKKLAKVIWSKALYIAIISVFLAVVGFMYSTFFVVPMYSATAQVWAGVFDDSTSEYQNTLTVQYRLETFAAVTKTEAVLSKVHETIQMASESGAYDGPVYTVAQLQQMITTTTAKDTELFSITVKNADKRYAQFIANEVAKETCYYHEVVRSEGKFTIVQGASMPSAPYTSSSTTYALTFFFMGAVFSCVVIALIKIFDTRLTTEDDIKDAVDVVVVGVIPRYDFDTNKEVYSVKEGGN